jgi:hypothetical protein
MRLAWQYPPALSRLQAAPKIHISNDWIQAIEIKSEMKDFFDEQGRTRVFA